MTEQMYRQDKESWWGPMLISVDRDENLALSGRTTVIFDALNVDYPCRGGQSPTTLAC
jgi:hypothetical protein